MRVLAIHREGQFVGDQALNLVTRGADTLVLVGVGCDNARAMGQAVRYPLDLGHRRIAMLVGLSSHNDRASARIEGVRMALKKACAC